ncbi:MAG: AAA family ATPase, partial [Erysipelotrichaceae bacterium]|nr:AAA family ATPase [Erysipelotrichaceae bacterium]
MLKQLHVTNFALIDECTLDFHSGFTVFTGETGAGKSLLIDAISLLCGERASSAFVQRGKEKAEITGVLKLPSSMKPVLKEAGFENAEELTIQREITKDGKSSIKINGKNASLQTLKLVTANLIDIHSQHDTQYLLNKNSHIALLDETISDHPLLSEVRQSWMSYTQAKKQLEQFENVSVRESDADYLRYEIEEIEKAHLTENEDEELEARLKTIQGFEKIFGRLNEAVELFEKDRG